MNHTTNLNLNLPEYADEADVASLNENMQIIDYAVGDLDDDIAMKVTQPSGGAFGQVLEMGDNGEVQWGDKIPSEDVVQAVEDWLETNMPPQETIVVDQTLTVQGAAADAKAAGTQIRTVTKELYNTLVSESPFGEQVVLSNIDNCSSFYSGVITGGTGFTKVSFENGVATFSISSNSETSPYLLYNTTNYGEKNWIVGFKFRITKPDQSLGDPEAVRIHLGTQNYDFNLTLNNWINFAETLSIDLTRIRFALVSFASAPVAGQFIVEIKDMYVYDATGVNSAMCNYIMEQQNTNYTDGTVTYGESSPHYPDQSLSISGKSADSKAVGDALNGKIDKPNNTGTIGQVLTLDNNLVPVWQTHEESEIDDSAGLGDTDKTWSANKLTDKFGEIESDFSDLFVLGSGDYETATLTNVFDAEDYNEIMSSEGFSRESFSQGIINLKNTVSSSTLISPYVTAACNKGTGNWLVGFKYRFTKIGEVGDPQQFRIHAGQSDITDVTPVFGEWLEYSRNVNISLTRIRIAAREFAVAPAANTIRLEIKDMYVYDVDGISNRMINHIIQQQSQSYQNGTVTYVVGSAIGYAPDQSLEISGKAADSKAVGDAIDNVADIVSKKVSATLTNKNAAEHIFTSGAWGYVSYDDGIYSFIPTSYADYNVYGTNACNLGSGRWLVSFKYKITKIDQQLSDPVDTRVILGASNGYTYTNYLLNEWNDFTQIAEVDLTRVYFSVRGFTTVPTSTQIKLEIKEFYIYDLTAVNNNLFDTIIDSQNQNYKSGTVTYEKRIIADEIALSLGRINVLNYGIKGDGVTDNTEVIRRLFSSQSGDFYFPSGSYLITGTITIPDNSTMYGDGDTTVIDMHSCNDLSECTFRGGDKIYPYILVNSNNTKLHDFKLIGNSTNHTKRHAGVLMMDAENCFISNLVIYNINYNAIQTEPNVSAYGICILRSYRAYIDHCYVEQCGYECIGIADLSHHCVVSNCITKNGWRTCIQVHRGAYDVDIISNQLIQDAQAWDACFTLHGLQDTYLVRNLRIEGNTFKATVSPRPRLEEYASVVQLMSYCDGLWFINNRVEAGDRDLAAESTVSHLVLMGNIFQASYTSDYRLRIVSSAPIIVGNILENTNGTTQEISANAVKMANIGI